MPKAKKRKSKNNSTDSRDFLFECFGISTQKMKPTYQKIVEEWNDDRKGYKLTLARSIRELLRRYNRGTMGITSYNRPKCYPICRLSLSKELQKKFYKNGKDNKKGYVSDPGLHVPISFRSNILPNPKQQTQILLDINIQELESNDILRVSNVLTDQTVQALRNMVSQAHTKNTPTYLSDSAGNGVLGKYFYFHPPDYLDTNGADVLKQLKRKIATALYGKNTPAYQTALKTRYIGLGYGEGGENWTHQDQQKDSEYQVLIMLSNPSEDFTGGELYVQNGAIPLTVEPKPCCTSQFSNGGKAGDIVIFKANGELPNKMYHGMTTVKKGTNDMCERWAIGMFQGRQPSK